MLAHGAVGGFLMHCEQSSLAEGLLFGRPLIMLPIMGDQECAQNEDGQTQGRKVVFGQVFSQGRKVVFGQVFCFSICIQCLINDCYMRRFIYPLHYTVMPPDC